MEFSLYLVFYDKRFASLAKRELTKSHIRIIAQKKYPEGNFLAVSAPANSSALVGLPNRSIFIDTVIPIVKAFKRSKNDDARIVNQIAANLNKNEQFRIEALHLNSGINENAKSAEVRLGTALEAMGFTANLAKPKRIFYVIFCNENVFVGKLGAKSVYGALDAFRRFNNRSDKVSRAEYKLVEALEYFKVNTDNVKNALDIGAAPGGWSKVVSGMGIPVVAVDKAELDKSLLKIKNIRHIRKSANSVNLGSRQFDMLLIDTNTDPETSAAIALRFSKNLRKGAYLILTIKLVSWSINRHIEAATRIIKKGYKSIKLKKLQHNRFEVTCFAVKR